MIKPLKSQERLIIYQVDLRDLSCDEEPSKITTLEVHKQYWEQVR